MNDLTDEDIARCEQTSDFCSEDFWSLLSEVKRHRAAVAANEERVRSVVREDETIIRLRIIADSGKTFATLIEPDTSDWLSAGDLSLGEADAVDERRMQLAQQLRELANALEYDTPPMVSSLNVARLQYGTRKGLKG
jgi:hypothetical protein